MTTLSFYARGDGSTANNAALNVENTSQQPTVLITFNSGPSGDIILERNGGAPDPDTTVTINGTSYSFVVELTGGLPATNKVPTALQGLEIAVISVQIGGNTERFFFVTDGSGTLTLMNQFGNGAISLSNADFNPPPVYICFCSGTMILTPGGYRAVQFLRPGDVVITDDGDERPIRWIGHWAASEADMRRDPELRPVRIRANAIAPGTPFADLYLSGQHRIVVQDPVAELLFGEGKVLVAAKYLFRSQPQPAPPPGPVNYYHLLLDAHAMVISNGLATESYQPSLRAFGGMAPDAQASFRDAVPEALMTEFFNRRDAMLSLKAYEAEVLATMIGPTAASAAAALPRAVAA